MGIAGVTDRPLTIDALMPNNEARDALYKVLKGGRYEPEYLVETENGAPPKLPAPSTLTNKQKRIDFIQNFGSVEAQKALKAIQDSDLSKGEKNLAIRNLVNDIRAGVTLLKAERGDSLTDLEKNAYITAVLTRMPADEAALEKALTDHPEGGKAAVVAYLQNLKDAGIINPTTQEKLEAMFDKAVELNGGDEDGAASKLLDGLTWVARPDTEDSMKPVVDGKTATSRFGNYNITLTTNEETGKKEAIIKNVVTGEETVVDPLALKDCTFDLEDPEGFVRFDLLGDEKTVVVTIKPFEDTPDSETPVLKWSTTGEFSEVKNEELRQSYVDNWSPNALTLYEISGKQHTGAHFNKTPPPKPPEPAT